VQSTAIACRDPFTTTSTKPSRKRFDVVTSAEQSSAKNVPSSAILGLPALAMVTNGDRSRGAIGGFNTDRLKTPPITGPTLPTT
jgi:hypothetical protein